MFGRARRRATEHTINAIRPLIATYQHVNGLPARFWEDQYVLGFIGFMIAFHGAVTSGEKLSQADKGYLLADVLTGLSNLNGQAIARHFTQLSVAKDQFPDFKRGSDNASAIALVSVGRVEQSNVLQYELAKHTARQTGEETSDSAIVGIMMHSLFFEAIRHRFTS